MNGIIQEQKTLQGSRNHQNIGAASSSLTRISEEDTHLPRQILFDTSLLQNEFAAEQEHAHWGLNE